MFESFDQWTRLIEEIHELYANGVTNCRGPNRQAKLKTAKNKLLDFNEERRKWCADRELTVMQSIDTIRDLRHEVAQKNELIEELTLERDDLIRESDELGNKLNDIEIIVDCNLKAKEEYENNDTENNAVDESNDMGSN